MTQGQDRSQTHLSVPAGLLLDLQLCLDAVAEVSSLVSPVPARLPEVGAGVREHGLRLRLRRLQLDARRGDRLRDAASLHVPRLICKTKVQLLKVKKVEWAEEVKGSSFGSLSIVNK